ncbi:two-component system regulatory protein YycI [Virgibacillus sp. DJP39]|uniref:two-component system regulatory protein YycI n=1 Tax=Virgibacillus sp. DJP39 TaxID=3409790 RepID=UPI003BB5419E
MQWSQIKTLFILCFFVLNVFLLVQFVNKQNKEDLDELKDQQEATIEENLKSENIKIRPEKLPEAKEGSYIKVVQQQFSEEDISMIKGIKKQTTAVINNDFIISKLNEPFPINQDASNDEIVGLVKKELEIISQESYVFWNWNEEMNVLVFFQEKKARPIYFNQNGMLLVFLNEKNEISFYTQSLLGEVVDKKEQVPLVKPLTAINVLYQKNSLISGEEVTAIDIGFYTRLADPDGPQVFAPTWKVSVDGERSYFVNAIEGYIFLNNDMEFLTNSIKAIIEKVDRIENDSVLKNYLVNMLKKRLEPTKSE